MKHWPDSNRGNLCDEAVIAGGTGRLVSAGSSGEIRRRTVFGQVHAQRRIENDSLNCVIHAAAMKGGEEQRRSTGIQFAYETVGTSAAVGCLNRVGCDRKTAGVGIARNIDVADGIERDRSTALAIPVTSEIGRSD